MVGTVWTAPVIGTGQTANIVGKITIREEEKRTARPVTVTKSASIIFLILRAVPVLRVL